MKRALLVLTACLGCGKGEVVLFPANYASTYVEVRGCRPSGDHDLNNIRVLADQAALGPYRNRNDPFPTGAVVLKEEHDFADTSCTGPIKQWTVMVYRQKGSSPTTLDWTWQKVSKQREVITQDEARCYSCHSVCGKPPDGYEGTCAVP